MYISSSSKFSNIENTIIFLPERNIIAIHCPKKRTEKQIHKNVKLEIYVKQKTGHNGFISKSYDFCSIGRSFNLKYSLMFSSLPVH